MNVNSKRVDAEEDLDCRAPDDFGLDCDVFGDAEARFYHGNGMLAY